MAGLNKGEREKGDVSGVWKGGNIVHLLRRCRGASCTKKKRQEGRRHKQRPRKEITFTKDTGGNFCF